MSDYLGNSGEWMLQITSEVLKMEGGKEYKRREYKERCDRLKGKKLHGRFGEKTRDVGTERSWQWLKGGHLSPNMEGFLFAAQEQALRTRWFRLTIEKANVGPECRYCKQENETVMHITSGCGKLSTTSYKTRHDRMGLRVYWGMCKRAGIPCARRWHEETPDSVRKSEGGKFEIWWDRPVETTVKLDHYRPDVILIDKDRKDWTIVDFSVPWDTNVVKKDEKITRYLPLAMDIRKVHGVSTKIVPIEIGGLGVVPKRLAGCLKDLQLPDIIGGLQTSALYGTYNVLRKVLNTNE